jgi:hypothetical protein
MVAMRCPACGTDVIAEAVFCHKCGQRLDAAGSGTAPDERAAETPAPAAGAGPDVSALTRLAGPDQPEQELWRGGFSSKAMLGAWALCGLVSLLLLIGGIWWARTGGWWLSLLLLMVLPWLYCLAVLGCRRLGVHYVLTTRRFIHERGILRRINDRIELLDMDDITSEQKLWDRLTGVGTIRIASHDRTDPELFLPGIDNVKEVATLLDNARLAERRRRGLHVEQI